MLSSLPIVIKAGDDERKFEKKNGADKENMYGEARRRSERKRDEQKRQKRESIDRKSLRKNTNCSRG